MTSSTGPRRPPWRAGRILVAASPESTHGVDVTDTFAQGVASLQARDAYLRGLGRDAMTDPEELLEAMSRPAGTRMGTRYATMFEVIDL
jgi:hypothetical protein